MPRVINVAIPESLHRAAKTMASAAGVTLKAFIVEALMAATGMDSYPDDHDSRDGAAAV